MDGKENKDLLTSTNFTFYFSDEMSSFIKNNLIQKKKKKKRQLQTNSFNEQAAATAADLLNQSKSMSTLMENRAPKQRCLTSTRLTFSW